MKKTVDDFVSLTSWFTAIIRCTHTKFKYLLSSFIGNLTWKQLAGHMFKYHNQLVYNEIISRPFVSGPSIPSRRVFFLLLQINANSNKIFFYLFGCVVRNSIVSNNGPNNLSNQSEFIPFFLYKFPNSVFFSRALNQRFHSFSSTTKVRISSWPREEKGEKNNVRICVSKITIAVVKTNLWLLHTKSNRQQHEIKAKTFVTVN